MEWLEEPIRHDDLVGNRTLARALRSPLQIGENFDGPQALEVAVPAGAADLVMPDVARIGGVTGWQQAAAIAGWPGLEMLRFLLPAIRPLFMSPTPTAPYIRQTSC